MAIPAFPTLPGWMYPIPRTASGKSERHEAIAGRRTILPLMTTPRWTWDLPIEFLRTPLWRGNTYSEWPTLAGFFNACTFAGSCFAWTDPDDSVATAQPFGQGDGVTMSFQIVRTFGGFTEPVYLPTITQITIAGTPTVAYTVSASGVVTFATAPANGAQLAWTGTFAWLCRFDDDALSASQIMSGLYEVKSIKFSNEISP